MADATTQAMEKADNVQQLTGEELELENHLKNYSLLLKNLIKLLETILKRYKEKSRFYENNAKINETITKHFNEVQSRLGSYNNVFNALSASLQNLLSKEKELEDALHKLDTDVTAKKVRDNNNSNDYTSDKKTKTNDSGSSFRQLETEEIIKTKIKTQRIEEDLKLQEETRKDILNINLIFSELRTNGPKTIMKLKQISDEIINDFRNLANTNATIDNKELKLFQTYIKQDIIAIEGSLKSIEKFSSRISINLDWKLTFSNKYNFFKRWRKDSYSIPENEFKRRALELYRNWSYDKDITQVWNTNNLLLIHLDFERRLIATNLPTQQNILAILGRCKVLEKEIEATEVNLNNYLEKATVILKKCTMHAS